MSAGAKFREILAKKGLVEAMAAACRPFKLAAEPALGFDRERREQLELRKVECRDPVAGLAGRVSGPELSVRLH